MRNTGLRRGLLAAGVTGALGVMACSNAFAVSWTNASGANSSFGWSGGFNNTGRFGDPTVTTAGFFFFNTVNFSASGGGGTGASATDFARVTVDRATSVPAGGPAVTSIRVKEFGTWSSAISQPSDFTVQADYSIFRFNPAPVGATGSLPMAVTFFPDGTWTAERDLVAGAPGNPPFADLAWNRWQITVTNTIQVNAAAPAGSTIVKTGMRIITPEPTSILMLLAGLGPIVLRRSSRRVS